MERRWEEEEEADVCARVCVCVWVCVCGWVGGWVGGWGGGGFSVLRPSKTPKTHNAQILESPTTHNSKAPKR